MLLVNQYDTAIYIITCINVLNSGVVIMVASSGHTLYIYKSILIAFDANDAPSFQFTYSISSIFINQTGIDHHKNIYWLPM